MGIEPEVSITVVRNRMTVSIVIRRGNQPSDEFELTYPQAASLRTRLSKLCSPPLNNIRTQGDGVVHVETASVQLALSTFYPATPETPDGGVGGPAPWVLSMPVALKLFEDLSAVV